MYYLRKLLILITFCFSLYILIRYLEGIKVLRVLYLDSLL